MKEIKSVIELQTNDSEKRLLFATRYLVETHLTFDVTIQSGDFSGKSNFCVSIEDVEVFCDTLKKMHLSLSGSARLNDIDSDTFIRFEVKDNGHLFVSGQVGDSYEEQFVKFKFRTDQTCIFRFVTDFKSLLKDLDD